jgi:hypothetical protein
MAAIHNAGLQNKDRNRPKPSRIRGIKERIRKEIKKCSLFITAAILYQATMAERRS